MPHSRHPSFRCGMGDGNNHPTPPSSIQKMSKIDGRLNVVVVGGGGAGTPVVNELSAKLDPSKHNLILITSRPYYTHLVGSIRMFVSEHDHLEEQILMPYENNFVDGNGTLIVGTVTSIADHGNDGGAVVLLDGETVDYSILVLTPGSIWEGPLAMPDTKHELAQWMIDWRQRMEKANDILLVGGGAIAVEYSGEFKDVWPDKNITIIHGKDMLLNDTYPKKWRRDVEQRVRYEGVNLILGDFVDDIPSDGSGAVRTRNGITLEPDLIIPCRGGRPNTKFIASLGSDVLTESGHVKVKPTLQLPKRPRIFAAGDVTDWDEQKQVGKYYAHASVVAKNVLAILNRQVALAHYKGSYEMIVITIGKTRGASYFGILWGLMFGNWLSSMLKSKSLLIGATRKRMGLTAS